MTPQPLRLHPKTLAFETMFLGIVVLAPLSVLAAVATNAVWLVPLLFFGGELMIYLHQRHIGVLIDETRNVLIVQNFFVRYVIPYSSIERIGPGSGRWGPPARNFPVSRRGGGSTINVTYRGPDGSERVVAPMGADSSFLTDPSPSALTQGLADLCHRRSVPCDLSEFGQPVAAAHTEVLSPSSPTSPTPAAAPKSSNLFYVNGRGVQRSYAIASVGLFVGAFASTGFLHSGDVFYYGALAALGLMAFGRSRGNSSTTSDGGAASAP